MIALHLVPRAITGGTGGARSGTGSVGPDLVVDVVTSVVVVTVVFFSVLVVNEHFCKRSVSSSMILQIYSMTARELKLI